MKNILCIRHGKAVHNELSEEIGDNAYFLKESFDAPLVKKGFNQAKDLGENSEKLKNVEVVVVSTLTRTLQTAVSIFENNQKFIMIALDTIKEYPQGLEICIQRRKKMN